MATKTYFRATLIALKADWAERIGSNGNIERVEVRRFKIKCGAPCGCNGVLGYMTEMTDDAEFLSRHQILDNAGGFPNMPDETRKWLVSHPKKYSRDDDGAYHVVTQTKQREDRINPAKTIRISQHKRRLPPGYETESSKGNDGFGIVGQFPDLPAIIFCPEAGCGRPQSVCPPD